MMKTLNISKIVTAALLCAVGIIIPMYSPLKIVMEPASYTLGSHIAIFIAMFISPYVALTVSIVTAFGFLFGGFPIVVVIRALSHVVFALIGAAILKKKPDILGSGVKAAVFSVLIGAIHALSEMAVVMPFYFGNNMSEKYYAKGFLVSVALMVGVGTLIHSMVDFGISLVIWKAAGPAVRAKRLS